MRYLTILLLFGFLPSFAQSSDPYLGIIPAPVSVKKSNGSFKLTPETIIMVDSPDNKAIRFFSAWLKKSGYSFDITNINLIDKKRRGMKNVITLAHNYKGSLPLEGYELQISENNILLNGSGPGMFYGLQTLMQLIQNTSPGYATVPCALIQDQPRFAYRGMHLDVVRHFFDVDFVKKYIDLMASYKLNYFHWHLTDDQGWRIEIKKYPKLTEVGSKRAQTLIGKPAGDQSMYDNTPHGGFYTQEQIQEIVAYAHERYITVIPEIEMPGHSLAAIAAYPEMSCNPAKPYKVGEDWPTPTDVFCPTEKTFEMLEDILHEVMLLFPGKYIHIGGDECKKDAWKQSDFCRQLIADQTLRDENGLQSYFIGRIEKYVNKQGHSIIGWDEILEGGLAPNATVMSWRGETGGIAAAQLNHDVIMTPASGGLYFDHCQSKSAQEPLCIGGNAPLEKTYNYDPIPQALNKEQQKHILGVQANLWTEYIATPAKVEYMLLPRLFALAEIAWTPQANKNLKTFTEARVPQHLAWLDAKGYNYRVPVPAGAADTTVTGSDFNIDLRPTVLGAKIYYSINGNPPGETDLLYTAPLKYTVPSGKTMTFQSIQITPSGKRSVVTAIKMKNG